MLTIADDQRLQNSRFQLISPLQKYAHALVDPSLASVMASLTEGLDTRI